MARTKKNKGGEQGSEPEEKETVYVYDPQTGVYVGPFDRDEADEKGLYYSTSAPSPVAEDETAVYKNKTWYGVKTRLIELRAQVVAKRDKMLAATDWTQVEDSHVDKKAFAEYRKELRDLTKQTDFPEKVEWPALPSFDAVAQAAPPDPEKEKK